MKRLILSVLDNAAKEKYHQFFSIQRKQNCKQEKVYECQKIAVINNLEIKFKMSLKKLEHIDELPRNPIFTASQINRFLPIHYPTLQANVLGIFYNMLPQLEEQYNVQFYPDLTLKQQINEEFQTYKQSNSKYQQIRFVWCEDIDKQPDHIRKSLEIGVIIADYLHSLCKQKPTIQIPNYQSLVTRCQRLSLILGQPNYTKLNVMNQYPKHFKQNSRITFSYLFWKGQDKNYFGIGFNSSPVESSFNLLRCFREWNNIRFQIEHQMEPYRCISQLFTISRTFISDNIQDFNNNKRILKKMNEDLAIKDLSKLELSGLIKSYKLQEQILDNEKNLVIVAYKAKIMLRNDSYQQQNKLWTFLAFFWSQLLLATQIDTSCSHAVQYNFDNSTNELLLVFSLAYTATYQSYPVNSISIQKMNTRLCQFLKQKHLYKIYKEETVADQVFKKSINILNKFHHSPKKLLDKSQAKSMVNKYSPIKNSNNLVQSQIIPGTPISKLKQSSKKQQNQETPVSFVQVQNKYFELLEQIQKKQKIYSPEELRTIFYNNIKQVHRRYKIDPKLSAEQHKIMKSVASICLHCTDQQVMLLIQNFPSDLDSIAEVFLQPQEWQRAVNIGIKIGKTHLIPLYKKYLRQGMPAHRYQIIPNFLKKIIFKLSNNEENTLLNENIPTSDLIRILTGQSFNSSLYFNFVKKLMPFLIQDKQIWPIVNIIRAYYQQLMNELHHEQLFYSFLMELIFESCYFYDEGGNDMLRNDPYRGQTVLANNLKSKKFLMLLRNYGFKGLGYQCKQLLNPYIGQQSKKIKMDLLRDPVYYLVSIKKPLYLQRFFELLKKAHYTPTLITIIKYFQQRPELKTHLMKPKTHCYLLETIKEFEFNERQTSVDQQILEGVKSSQSGIFFQLIKRNPDIKIAGLALSRIFNQQNNTKNNFSALKNRQPDTMDINQIVQKSLPQEIKNVYQLIHVVISLREKYIKYHMLDQGQRKYFKNIAKELVNKKKQILTYIEKMQQIVSYQKQLSELPI